MLRLERNRERIYNALKEISYRKNETEKVTVARSCEGGDKGRAECLGWFRKWRYRTRRGTVQQAMVLLGIEGLTHERASVANLNLSMEEEGL